MRPPFLLYRGVHPDLPRGPERAREAGDLQDRPEERRASARLRRRTALPQLLSRRIQGLCRMFNKFKKLDIFMYSKPRKMYVFDL